jgi:Flp pilus assembly protein TadD
MLSWGYYGGNCGERRFRVMDIIELIGTIRWPVAVLLFLIFFCLLFRRQIKGGLERMTKFRFRGGGAELSVDGGTSQMETGQEARGEEKVISEEKTSKEAIEARELKEPVTAEDLAREMFIAFTEKDIKRGEKAYERLQDAEASANKKLLNEVWYYYLLFGCGDISALKKLEDLAKNEEIDPEVKHIAQRSIGLCYEKASEFGKAEDAFKLAAEISSISESDRAEDQVSLARCLFKNDKKDKAFDLLMSAIAQTSDESALAELYEGLANIYGMAEEREMRAIALERLVTIQPNNTRLRFKTAYSYSQEDFDSLALLHYKTMLKFKPEDPIALNNIAVAYNRLDMPIFATNFYKKAFQLKETLAAANLAYKYMNAGFDEEASEILKEARKSEKIDPKVGEAISDVEKKKKDESKSEEKAIKKAKEQQKFLLEFAEAYFVRISDSPEISGAWKTTEGDEIEIKQVEDNIEGIWRKANTDYRFEGNIVNRGAKITTYKKQYVWSSKEMEFVKDGKGYLYIASGADKINTMMVKERVYSFVGLARQ